LQARIEALPRETVDRIAAGEVVERPASVLKELLENSLDAGATRITLELAGGGIELLRVSDDGHGIDREELALAVRRHCTSKIRELRDIEGVGTFGFRGEALAALASVSILEILSRREKGESAWSLEVRDGKPGDTVPAARERGTTVSVRDLFGRVPVRRKFLKTESGEKRQVLRVWEQYLLAHPEVTFALVDEGVEKARYTATVDLKQRVGDLLGAELSRQMVDISGEEEGHRIEGLCSLPLTSRGNRNHQFIFLGRRPIQDDRVSHAIRQAYRDVLPPGRFPSCLLFLEVEPGLVDVNVHPTKREVRFRESSRIHSLVSHAIGRAISGGALGRRLADRPEMQLGGQRAESGAKPQSNIDFKPGPGPRPGMVREYQSGSREPLDIREAPAETEANREAEFWQLDRTFILTRIGEGLVIVDQHNAHERILYDRALANLDGRAPESQSLLFPHSLEISPSEMEAWRELDDFLETLGYRISEFGENTLAVEAIPAGLRRWDGGESLRELLADSLAEKGGRSERRDRALATYACKAAVKAGQILRAEEMRRLIAELFETRSPYTCPHGRPIIIRIGRDELEKRFHRIVPDREDA